QQEKNFKQQLAMTEQSLQNAERTIDTLCSGNEALKTANATLQDINNYLKNQLELSQSENTRLIMAEKQM
ncbi:hypothetical protein, partial [Faecalibaculum rodentium]|uniref:hypothetical protein n=1 Tax=Faecalibaculum rodentium TaxID=1702221 RepID=UPI0025A2B11A